MSSLLQAVACANEACRAMHKYNLTSVLERTGCRMGLARLTDTFLQKWYGLAWLSARIVPT